MINFDYITIFLFLNWCFLVFQLRHLQIFWLHCNYWIILHHVVGKKKPVMNWKIFLFILDKTSFFFFFFFFLQDLPHHRSRNSWNWLYLKPTKLIEMNWSRPNRSKWIEWTNVNRSGLKFIEWIELSQMDWIGL